MAPKLDIITAAEMQKLGIQFHSVHAIMSIVAKRRLEALAAYNRDTVSTLKLGEWLPLFDDEKTIEPNATAHPDYGHKIRQLVKKGKSDEPEVYRIGQLVSHNLVGSGQAVRIKWENGKEEDIKYSDGAKDFQVSSLGQMIPLTKKELVHTETLRNFFPKTVVGEQASLDTVIDLLMARNVIFGGPPGSGKSTLAKDILSMRPDYRFVVQRTDGQACRHGCHPYSLCDEKIAQVHPACPECKQDYSEGKFYTTGTFELLDPSKVKVIKQGWTTGFGVRYLAGSKTVHGTAIKGVKIPNTQDPTKNDGTPVGMILGAVSEANNGLLFIDEIDKVEGMALDALLSVIQDKQVSVDGVRVPLPADAYIVATANDASKLSDALDDRMVDLHVPYAQDMADMKKIHDISYHGMKNTGASVVIRDLTEKDKGASVAYTQDKDGNIVIDNPYRAQHSPLHRVPMTDIHENTILRIYAKFRRDRPDLAQGMKEIMGSGRSIHDAADAARAEYLVRTILDPEEEDQITDVDIAEGISYAARSRINVADSMQSAQQQDGVKKLVANNYPKMLEEEANAWWCEVRRTISTYARESEGLVERFAQELAYYRKNPDTIVTAFESMVKAGEDLNKLAELSAKVPFMSYLASHQRQFFALRPEKVQALVQTYLKLDPRKDE